MAQLSSTLAAGNLISGFQTRTTIGVSNSLDPDQDRHSVGHHLGSNCLQEGYWQTTKSSTGMQRVITDPRIRDYLFVKNPVPPALILLAYLLFIYWGPKWMKNREPFVMKEVIVIYNFGLVLLSAYTLSEFLLGGWLFDYTLGCQPMDSSYSPKALQIVHALWLFYITKFIELLDTVFFILRKKNNQVSFLHVFHHGSLPMFWWWGIRASPGGFGSFHPMVNSFVHVVMYFYYGVSALGPKYQKYLWWKRYVTVLQLTQFLIITLHNSQYLFMECEYPVKIVIVIQVFCTIVAILFLNFYIQTYWKKRKHVKSENAVSNGHCQNGVVNGGHLKGDLNENVKDGVHTRNGFVSNGDIRKRSLPAVNGVDDKKAH